MNNGLGIKYNIYFLKSGFQVRFAMELCRDEKSLCLHKEGLYYSAV